MQTSWKIRTQKQSSHRARIHWARPRKWVNQQPRCQLLSLERTPRLRRRQRLRPLGVWRRKCASLRNSSRGLMQGKPRGLKSQNPEVPALWKLPHLKRTSMKCRGHVSLLKVPSRMMGVFRIKEVGQLHLLLHSSRDLKLIALKRTAAHPQLPAPPLLKKPAPLYMRSSLWSFPSATSATQTRVRLNFSEPDFLNLFIYFSPGCVCGCSK